MGIVGVISQQEGLDIRSLRQPRQRHLVPCIRPLPTQVVHQHNTPISPHEISESNAF